MKYTLDSTDQAMEGIDSDYLQVPADEVLGHIKLQKNLGVNVTVKSIVEHFEAKPYGWYLAATLCALARLVATSKIS
ncbi:MAG: hypothetical protein V9G25_09410 [Acidimicrobiia bacterium]